VLVVFAVLVVPVFLDGPSNEPEIVSERVPLPGQAEQGETRTVVLARDREEPVPAITEQPVPETRKEESARPSAPAQSGPAPVPDKPASQPDTAQAVAASSATGMWAVQLGSFGNQQNAERLAADLRNQGYAAFLSQLPTKDGALHRVRVGPQKDRASAEDMAVRLQKAGHKGQVVPHP
jgi:cell division septation protein DedD